MTRTKFRRLLIVYVASLAAVALDAWVFPVGVSEELASAYADEPLPPLARNHSIFVVFAVAMIGAVVAAPIALLFFRKSARTFSMCVTLAVLIVLPFLGPSLDSGLGLAMSQLSAMLWGGILALAYFSPLRDEFR